MSYITSVVAGMTKQEHKLHAKEIRVSLRPSNHCEVYHNLKHIKAGAFYLMMDRVRF